MLLSVPVVTGAPRQSGETAGPDSGGHVSRDRVTVLLRQPDLDAQLDAPRWLLTQTWICKTERATFSLGLVARSTTCGNNGPERQRVCAGKDCALMGSVAVI
jgi:hypothetical protein